MLESGRERRGHRIRVSQKKSDEATLIQQIQLLALKRGKTLPADRIRGWISQLLDTVCLNDEEGRTHLLIHLAMEEDEDRWCLCRPDHAGFDSRSIFEGALVED
jgi:hypothetical protein